MVDDRTWRATKPFTDLDGVQIRAGQVIGVVRRRGYSEARKNWFWNGLLDGKVTCVTVGFPPFCEPVTSE